MQHSTNWIQLPLGGVVGLLVALSGTLSFAQEEAATKAAESAPATPALRAGISLLARAVLVQCHPRPYDGLARGNGLEATLEKGARRVVACFECRKVSVELKRGKAVRLIASAHLTCLP